MLLSRRLFHSLCVLFAAVLASATTQAQTQANHLIISQLYGGGGNSGSVYSNDFVELYNPTSAVVDLSTYSLQYASSAGTFSASNLLPLAGSVQPGKYFLIGLAPGANKPQDLPTPDLDTTKPPYNAAPYTSLNLSGTGGKIALVPSTALLTGACPAVTSYTDFVGWGTTANCSYNDATGANRAPATTNGTGLILATGNSWTGVNSADYTAVTPTPRNSSFGNSPASALSITSTTLNPAAVMQGNSTTLTVVVSPGPSTANIAVTADLTSLGGSSTAPIPLTSANTYSATGTVPSTTAPNTYPIVVTVTSSDPTVTGSANLTVNAALTTTPISTIQANRATYIGGAVQFQGVVTVVTGSGYYLQTPSTTPGSTGDEGIYVYTGSQPPSAVAVGNLLTVNGTLKLFPLATNSHTPALEVTSASINSNGTAALPPPISLPANFPTADGGIYQFTRYESMLVKVPSLTAISGTDGNLNETTETTTSTGQFYAVATGTPRPFREPGMDFRDFPAATCPTVANCTATATSVGVARPSALQLYDDNPERFIVESSLGGGTPLDVSAGAVLTNVSGVVDFSYSTDSPYGDPARIILQPGQVTAGNYTPGITVQPLAVPGANQVTIAAFNIERFYNTSSADNKYRNPATGKINNSDASTVTADAYARRLKKVSLAIRTVLNTPDVLSIEETENVSVLRDISAQIDADATAAGQTPPHYAAYGTDSSSTFTDDGTGISVGFLVKPATVDVVSWQQVGQDTTFTNSSGNAETLNDRPSQVLHVGFKRPGGASDYAMTLISNHLKALTGVNGLAPDTRTKKELQAEGIANLIQGYQANGERVLSMGDYNAFEFSDGYTDTLGTATGRVSAPGTAVQPGRAILNPPATDLVTLLPANQRQSYTEYGNAQVLDHIEATSNVVAQTQLAYAHLDADFPLTAYNDATTPARTSDHDAALAYLTLPAPVVSGTLTGTGVFPAGVAVGSSSAGQQLVLTNTGEAAISITGIAATGDFVQTSNCGASLPVGSTCQISVVFKPSAAGARTGTLTVSSNATGVLAASLTGTGVIPATFAFTATGGTAITVQHGQAAQIPLTLTPTGTFSGAVTLTCTGLPANASCDFGSGAGAPGKVTLSVGTAQTVTLLLRTSTLNSGVAKPALLPSSSNTAKLALAIGLPGLLLAGLNKRKRGILSRHTLLLAFALVSLAATLGFSGCSSNSVPNTTNTTPAAAGTSTVVVTASSATVTQTIALNLTIQ